MNRNELVGTVIGKGLAYTVKAYYVFIEEFKLDSNSVPDESDSDLPDFD